MLAFRHPLQLTRSRYIENFQSHLTLEVFVIYNFVVPAQPMANKPLERPYWRIPLHKDEIEKSLKAS